MKSDKQEQEIEIDMSKETVKHEIYEEKVATIEFKEMSLQERAKFIAIVTLKPIGILICLYFFVCSLDFMSTSFKLIAGKYASEALSNNVILKNPLAGLILGLLVTVLVQSSSTSTSIVVSMVASGILTVKTAIPIIMGTNIGTSVTSCLVSISQMSNKDNFRRAFAGANVHEMFNYLSVLVLLPIEILTGYLRVVSGLIVNKLFTQSTSHKEPEFLTVITKPFTHLIIQLDKNVLELIATNKVVGNETLIKHKCEKVILLENGTQVRELERCKFLLEPLEWKEWLVGLLLLVVSLVALMSCLIIMVKLLSSVFKGPVAKVVERVVNADFPWIFKYLTPYAVMALGCVLTILVQSSSVFTSTLVPLVGLGLVKLERVFPMVLGANLGTTVTGILAALSASSNAKISLQIALCHTLFNLTGILIWYPIPFMRLVPLNISKKLANIVSNYKWFVFVYLFSMFLIFPILLFAISLAGWLITLIVVVVLALLIILIIVINVLQTKRPKVLPQYLRDWSFLPMCMRSLRPYDNFFRKYILCCKCCNKFSSNQIEMTIESTENTRF